MSFLMEYIDKQIKMCYNISDGYFVCSIGNVSKEVIEKYIQEQG